MQQTNTTLNVFPKSMLEAEKHKCKINSNLENHQIDKLYNLNTQGSDAFNVPNYVYPHTFTCIDSFQEINTVNIYQIHKGLTQNTVQYIRIGGGRFWNGPTTLQQSQITTTSYSNYFVFDSETDLVH